MSQYDIEITPLNTKLDTSKLHKLDLANDAKSSLCKGIACIILIRCYAKCLYS